MGFVYEVTQSVQVIPDHGRTTVYGLRISCEGQTVHFPDLSVSREAVERFGALLKREGVSFCHLQDLVEDFLPLES